MAGARSGVTRLHAYAGISAVRLGRRLSGVWRCARVLVGAQQCGGCGVRQGLENWHGKVRLGLDYVNGV